MPQFEVSLTCRIHADDAYHARKLAEVFALDASVKSVAGLEVQSSIQLTVGDALQIAERNAA